MSVTQSPGNLSFSKKWDAKNDKILKLNTTFAGSAKFCIYFSCMLFMYVRHLQIHSDDGDRAPALWEGLRSFQRSRYFRRSLKSSRNLIRWSWTESQQIEPLSLAGKPSCSPVRGGPVKLVAGWQFETLFLTGTEAEDCVLIDDLKK